MPSGSGLGSKGLKVLRVSRDVGLEKEIKVPSDGRTSGSGYSFERVGRDVGYRVRTSGL